MSLTASYRARWIVPVDQPPIEGGVVTVHNGRIVAVGQAVTGTPVHDLGDVVLLPGLVNAHTHLEFSLLDQPLGQAGMGFADWIAVVVQHRKQQTQQLMVETDGFQRFRRRSAQAGLTESRVSGVAAIGDIATPGWPRECFPAAELNATIFLELLGLDPSKHDSLMNMARSFVQDVQDTAGDLWPGLSPHAPYTASPQLVTSACQLSALERFPVAMHLAESRDELELLATKRGRMVEVLEAIGAWHPDALPAASAPLDYLKLLATAHRALVVHGNYLTSDEIHFLGEHRERMSAIYCPRTHAFFGHERYPLSEMLSAGVRVAVGTDSRASNPDLKLWEELKLIARQHPNVPPDQVLRMGTLNGAEALGIDHDYGSVTLGKVARLAVVRLSQRTATPYDSIFTSGGSADPLAQFLERNRAAPPR